jgi:hypothetical protein
MEAARQRHRLQQQVRLQSTLPAFMQHGLLLCRLLLLLLAGLCHEIQDCCMRRKPQGAAQEAPCC